MLGYNGHQTLDVSDSARVEKACIISQLYDQNVNVWTIAAMFP